MSFMMMMMMLGLMVAMLRLVMLMMTVQSMSRRCTSVPTLRCDMTRCGTVTRELRIGLRLSWMWWTGIVREGSYWRRSRSMILLAAEGVQRLGGGGGIRVWREVACHHTLSGDGCVRGLRLVRERDLIHRYSMWIVRFCGVVASVAIVPLLPTHSTPSPAPASAPRGP